MGDWKNATDVQGAWDREDWKPGSRRWLFGYVRERQGASNEPQNCLLVLQSQLPAFLSETASDGGWPWGGARPGPWHRPGTQPCRYNGRSGPCGSDEPPGGGGVVLSAARHRCWSLSGVVIQPGFVQGSLASAGLRRW